MASLLLPALATAKEKARQTRCRGNLRQIGLAPILYVQDHERYPYGVTFLNNREEFFDWEESLAAVTQNKRTSALFRCPSYKGPTEMRVFTGTGWSSPSGSYLYNTWGTGFSGTRPGLGLGGW